MGARRELHDQALWVAACPDEADKFFDFMADVGRGARCDGAATCRSCSASAASATSPSGSSRTSPGWRDSAPVRVGNGAWNQRQLDVYGELLDAAAALPEQLDASSARRPAAFLADLADAAAARWHEQDQGIWEVRGEPRDFLYSKLMCWVALDRAIALADLPRRARSGRRLEARPRARSPTRS